MASATSSDPEDAQAGANKKQEAAMPLPGWLNQVYFLFPIVLYIPDAIFNYYVYSDGVTSQSHDPVGQAFWSVIWGMVAVGVVGMAYLLSILAPWHWAHGNRLQALASAFGVVVATAITTWNSLSYRSTQFVDFKTDSWVYAIWPQLQQTHFSLTMVLVSVAPPFWGLFWAIVQPTQKGRSLQHMQESHQERLLRLQQEAEVKRMKAEVNAKIREAQLKGMAATAAAARDQAAGLMNRNRGSSPSGELPAVEAPKTPAIEAPKQLAIGAPGENSAPLDDAPLFSSSRRETTSAGRGREMFNHAASAPSDAPRAETNAAAAAFAQPSLLSDSLHGAPGADASDSWPNRPRPTVGAGIAAFFPTDTDMSGSGPRAAVRRAAEPSPLLQEMNTPAGFRQVKVVIDDLKAKGITSPTQKEVILAVQEHYEIDADMARKMVLGYKAAQKANRNS